MKIEVFLSPLIPTTTFEMSDKFVDLHNDFDCRDIFVNEKDKIIILSFISVTSNQEMVKMIFENAKMIEKSYPYNETEKYITLNFLQEYILFDKQSIPDIKFFILNFIEGQSLNIKAQKIFLQF